MSVTLASADAERHESEHIGLGLIHQSGEITKARPQLIGNVAPGLRRCLSGVVGEDGADCGGNHTMLSL